MNRIFKLIIFSLILILLTSLSSASDLRLSGNLTGRDLFGANNLTHVQATTVSGEGSGLTNISTSAINGSSLNVNHSNTTSYWFNASSVNVTQMEVSNSVLRILTSWLDSLYERATNLFTRAQINSRDLQQNVSIELVNSSLQSEISLQDSNNGTQAAQLVLVNSRLLYKMQIMVRKEHR